MIAPVKEWDSPDYTGECFRCGQIKPVCMLPDPYIEALFPEDENAPEAYCYNCYCDRKDEV